MDTLMKLSHLRQHILNLKRLEANTDLKTVNALLDKCLTEVKSKTISINRRK